MPKIGVIPDLHIMSINREEVIRELKSVKERFEEFEPDIVVLPGDVIQDQYLEKDRENIREVRDILEDLDADIRFMAGNHDAVNLGEEELETLFRNELWGMETVKGENIIFLDTSRPDGVPQGRVTEEQVEFLENKLERVDEAIVFVHHPIHYHDTQDTYWWNNRPEAAFCMNKREINRLLEDEPKVKAVFNGHVHYNRHVKYRGIDHLNLNAFNKETRESGVTGTYVEITIDEKEITTEVKEGDELVISYSFPNKVKKN